jgi:hypothetical protein
VKQRRGACLLQQISTRVFEQRFSSQNDIELSLQFFQGCPLGLGKEEEDNDQLQG